MYSIPPEFAERLEREFDGRLRVRWSYQEGAFVVEQRVARRLADSFPVLGNDDDRIRLRDGYLKILSVRNGDRMPCPECGLTLRVPIFETRLISCEHCRLKGYNHQHAAGFFELNDRLIEYLQALDPMKGRARANRNRVDLANASVSRSHERTSSNLLEDAVSDNFLTIAGIPRSSLAGSKIMPGSEF
jgi:hypothetical protein